MLLVVDPSDLNVQHILMLLKKRVIIWYESSLAVQAEKYHRVIMFWNVKTRWHKGGVYGHILCKVKSQICYNSEL